jgi:long-chain acyl-CoA synthetase
MLIHHLLENSAQARPDHVALVHEATRMTYREVNDRANQFAHALLERGVGAGDRVALLMENGPEYVVGYYGTLKTGAVVVPLNTDFKEEGLLDSFRKLSPRVLAFSPRFERVLLQTDLAGAGLTTLVARTPKLPWPPGSPPILDWAEIRESGRRENPGIPLADGSLASVILTSGSTGTRKGAMLSHRNIVSNTQAICRFLELTRDEIHMVVLPFFYVMGKSLLNTHVAVGGTVVINNRFAFPAAVLEQMETEAVTGFSGVPSTYAYLLHRSPLAAYRDRLASLRYCAQAGGHMARSIKEDLRRVLPAHTKLFIMYGATEAAARLTVLDPDRFSDKMDSIGRAIPGVKIRVLDPKGEEVPRGQTGELVASGPNIMMGYWEDPETTARVLDEKGYHTGDLAYEDEEGFLHLVGRKDHLVKVGGHRINTQEVEDVLMDSGLLIEAVVLGVPDPLLGNRLAAIAVSKKATPASTRSSSAAQRSCPGTKSRLRSCSCVGCRRTRPARSIGADAST